MGCILESLFAGGSLRLIVRRVMDRECLGIWGHVVMEWGGSNKSNIREGSHGLLHWINNTFKVDPREL